MSLITTRLIMMRGNFARNTLGTQVRALPFAFRGRLVNNLQQVVDRLDLYRSGFRLPDQIAKAEDIHERKISGFVSHVNSHDLPNSVFWEDFSAKTLRKLLILLVGAAGFEPTTCSTQNCRATRLRYTPIIWEKTSIHA
jgi:hypothetical protein